MTGPEVLVAVGGGGTLGAVARQFVGQVLERDRRDTLAVNVLGSVILGYLTAAGVSGTALLVAGTGFCGAFTTFSSFAFETFRLAEEGETRPAVSYGLVTLVGALAGVAGGAAVASTL